MFVRHLVQCPLEVRFMSDKFERYHSVQGWFAKNSEIYTSTRQRALEVVSKKICDAMGIQRLGVWMFTITHDAIYEEITYSIDGEPSYGNILAEDAHPGYFKKINEERVISIDSTNVDQDLKGFAEIYMNPFHVRSLLDAPIFSDGTCIGVVCCETTDIDRQWDRHDKSFVASCADFIGRLIEAEKRHAYEKELKHRIDYLENDLRKKIDDLKGAKLSLELALEAAQAGKWDWDISTGKLNLNKTWFNRLGYEYDELPQILATFQKVLHPDDVAKTFDTLDKHLKGETAFYECRYRMITKAGEIQWCIDRGCVSKRSPEGAPLFATGVNINITPIIQLEQSLLVSELQLTAMIRSLPTPVAMFDKDFKYLAYSSKWYQEWSGFGEIQIGSQLTNSSEET